MSMILKIAAVGAAGFSYLLAAVHAMPMNMMPSPLGPTSTQMYLQVYEAGTQNGKLGAQIEDGTSICPSSYPTGFSIVCKGVPEGVNKVYLSFNGGRRRTERTAPYTIAGDRNGIARPLTNFGKEGIVKCWTKRGGSVEAKVSFTCDGPNATGDGEGAAGVEEMADAGGAVEEAGMADTGGMVDADEMGTTEGTTGEEGAIVNGGIPEETGTPAQEETPLDDAMSSEDGVPGEDELPMNEEIPEATGDGENTTDTGGMIDGGEIPQEGGIPGQEGIPVEGGVPEESENELPTDEGMPLQEGMPVEEGMPSTASIDEETPIEQGMNTEPTQEQTQPKTSTSKTPEPGVGGEEEMTYEEEDDY